MYVCPCIQYFYIYFVQMPTTLVLTVKLSLWRSTILIFTWSTVQLVVMLIHKCSSVENVEKCLLHWSTFNNISGDMNKITIPHLHTHAVKQFPVLQHHKHQHQLVIVNTSIVNSATNLLHKMKIYKNTYKFVMEIVIINVVKALRCLSAKITHNYTQVPLLKRSLIIVSIVL